METEEEEHIADPADDVVMAEQETVAAQNVPPPTGQAEVVVRQAEVAPREEIPQEDIQRDIINIPMQPAKVTLLVAHLV